MRNMIFSPTIEIRHTDAARGRNFESLEELQKALELEEVTADEDGGRYVVRARTARGQKTVGVLVPEKKGKSKWTALRDRFRWR